MSTRESRRIQHLRRCVIRLERELASLKAAPLAYVPYPVAPAYPVIYPLPVPSYPINPNPYPLTFGEPFTISNTTGTNTITDHLSANAFTVTATVTTNGYTTFLDGTTGSVNPTILND